MHKQKDEILVERILKGERDAFRALVEKYQRQVYALAFEMLHSREDAQDVTQESFVKAYLSIGDFRGDCSFYTWLYRIVYNMSIDYRRRISRRPEQVELNATVETEAGQEVMGRLEAPHESLLRREQRRQLSTALESITEEHRAVIMLREVEGLSYEEIAQVTGVSRGTVMSRLHYARKKLQSLLTEHDQKNSESAQGASLGKGDMDRPVPEDNRKFDNDINKKEGLTSNRSMVWDCGR